MSKRTIRAVTVEEVEKRRHPSKHYVYVIYVTWSDDVVNVIFRRYSKFFDLQVRLLDKFPNDSGYLDPTRRCIPFLPGKILLGRSHIREVALKRLKPIDDYCKKLVKLEPHISESLDVLDFFESKPDDFYALEHRRDSNISIATPGGNEANDQELKQISNPRLLEQYTVVEDYKKVGANEVSLSCGDLVEVVEKNKTGWWFITTDESQGWAPSSHLMPKDGTRDSLIYHQSKEGRGDQFIVHRSYKALQEDELSIDKGRIVEVLEQTLDGWWLVKFNNTRGRFPSTNLAKADTLRAQGLSGRPAESGVQIIRSLKDVNSPAKNPTQSSATPSSNNDTHLRPDWENVVKKSSPLPEIKKRPAPRSTPKKPDRPPLPSPSRMPQNYVTIEDFDSSAVGDGISFKKGQNVKVLEKTDQGWWFVDIEGIEGWAPSAYLQMNKTGPTLPVAAKRGNKLEPVKQKWPSEDAVREPVSIRNALQGHAVGSKSQEKVPKNNKQDVNHSAKENNKFVALHDYTGEEKGELTFTEGQVVTLVTEHDQGWWQVKLESGQEGYAPSSYFEPFVVGNRTQPQERYENVGEQSYVSQNKNKIEKVLVLPVKAAKKPDVMTKPALRATSPNQKSQGGNPALPKKPLQPSNKLPTPAAHRAPQKSSKISEMAKMFE